MDNMGEKDKWGWKDKSLLPVTQMWREARRMEVIVKVTAARTVIPDWMILWFGFEIQTRLAYRRSVQSRLCHVVSPRYFNVIPWLRTVLYEMEYISSFAPSWLFQPSYSSLNISWKENLVRCVILFYVFSWKEKVFITFFSRLKIYLMFC